MRFKNGKVVKDERLIGFMKTMPRYFRRNLCRNLGMSWQKYREMEGYKPKTSGLYIPPLFDLLYGKLRKIKNKMARHSRRVNRMRAA